MKNRSLRLILILVMLSGGLAAFLLWQKPAANKTLPNIVLVVADDIGYGDYSFANHPVIRTPHIDRLAREGVVFSNGYTTNSICRPSLASLITGLYPWQHGITVNARIINKQRDRFDWGLPPYARRMQELNTLPKELSKLGYRSLQTGKWWEEGFANGGFDEGDKQPEGLLGHVTRRNVIGREGLEPIFSFIDANKQRPFFIWYAPQMPHVPHNPPAQFLAPYQQTADERIAKYYGMVSWFDHSVGQIVQHLEQRGLRDNTLIIYLADNGYSIASDVLEDESHRGKDSAYETGIRTPIIFNWPKNWPAAQRDDLVSSIDVFPTLTDLLHIPSVALPGLSLLATLRDDVTLQRSAVVGENYLDTGKELADNVLTFRWIRARTSDGKNWKLITFADGRMELFDLANDPNEQHNLIAEPAHAAVRQQLLVTLQQTLPQ